MKNMMMFNQDELEITDYWDEEGLLCCGKCHTRKEYALQMPMLSSNGETIRVVNVPCKCEQERLRAIEEGYKTQEHKRNVERLKQICFTDKALGEVNFIKCDKVSDSVFKAADAFLNHWNELKHDNTGLLFWGGVGNGKSTMAAAIANDLLEEEEMVVMRNLGNFLNATFEEKEYLFQLISDASLLILDDFGMERGSEYAMEIVFQVIDARYNSKKPMIITTNLSLETLKNPSDLRYKRIYDRVMEMCIPVQFTGESFRMGIQKAKLEKFKEYLEEEEDD